ncbi:MAG: nitroreductase family protein, partial [Firmicutes bacterium]|nr:nitroreductase family protein [Bacillota bacterium]
MNEVLTAIKERSSIRAYKPQMPEQEKLDAIINAGLQAPTANN